MSVFQATYKLEKSELYNGLHPGDVANYVISRDVYVAILEMLAARADNDILDMKHKITDMD